VSHRTNFFSLLRAIRREVSRAFFRMQALNYLFLHRSQLCEFFRGAYITNREFDAAVGDLKATLDKLQIANQEQKELLSMVEFSMTAHKASTVTLQQ